MRARLRFKPVARLLLFVSVLTLTSGGMIAQAQEVSGNIAEDTTWGSGETTVVGNVTVDAGVTLTVEAGATIRFDGNYSLTVNGQLVAEGTSASKITFTSARTSPSSGDWGSIAFTADAFPSSSLRHVTIRYAGTAISADGLQAPETLNLEGVQIYDVSGNGLSVTNSVVEMVAAPDGAAPAIEDFGSAGVYAMGRSTAVTVTGAEIRQTGSRVRSGSGLWVRDGATLTVSGSTVERCGVGVDVSHRRDNNDAPQTVAATGNIITENGTGVRVNPGDANRYSGYREEEYPELTVTGNAITSNVDWEVAIYRGKAARTTELDVTENWWGTRDGVAMAERIRDQSDDERSAFADFIPFLDAAPDAGGNPTDQDGSGRTFRAGRLDADEQWTSSDNIVLVGETIMEEQLSLEAGTTVRAQSNKLVVLGGMISGATASSPVTFTSNRSAPSPGDWGGVVLDGSTVNNLDYWRVRYAATGLTVRNVQPNSPVSMIELDVASIQNDAVVLEATRVTANGWTVTDTQKNAVVLDNSIFTATGWTITESGNGARVINESEGSITGGVFRDIGGTAVILENATVDGLDGAVIEDFGSAGVYATGRSSAVTVTGAEIRQTGSRVRSGSGLWVRDGATLTVSGSTVERCGVGVDVSHRRDNNDAPQTVAATGNIITENGTGVRVNPGDANRYSGYREEEYPELTVTGNAITSNVDWEVAIYRGKAARTTELDVTENWWGTRDGVAMAERIRDQSDDERSAFADFIPFLDAAPDAEGQPTSQGPNGEQYHAGRVTGYNSWARADNPHIVVGMVLVGAGGSLTVEGGSSVRILRNRIEAEGSIFLNGAEQNRIELKPYDSNTPWAGLRLSPPLEDAQIQYVTIRGADEGIKLSNVQPSDPSRTLKLSGVKIYDTSTGLNVSSSQLEVRHSEVVGFDNVGVSVSGGGSFLRIRDRSTVGQTGARTLTGTCLGVRDAATVVVQSSVLVSCSRGVNVHHNGGSPPPPMELTGSVVARHDIGVRVDPYNDRSAYPVVIANGNDIKNNNSFNVRIEPGKNAASTTLDFANNWWGTADSTTIAATVRDRNDSDQLATVDFLPASSAAVGTYGLADINADGRTDGFDLSLLAAAFGTQDGEPDYNPAANLYSEDARIDGFDLAILGTRFGDLGATDLKRLIPDNESKRRIADRSVWMLRPSSANTADAADTSVTESGPTLEVRASSERMSYTTGDTIRYALHVKDTPPLFAIAADLEYDASLLDFAGGEAGAFLQQGSQSVLGIASATGERLQLGLTRTQRGRWSSPKGGGQVAILTFVARTSMDDPPTLSLIRAGLLGPDARTPYQATLASPRIDGPDERVLSGIGDIYPNPVRSRVRLGFHVQESGPVRITVYNALGQRVRTLADRAYERGRHTIEQSVAGLATGAYFVRLEAPGGFSTKKFVVVR